ncbi:prolipoprotein diacylglyceryl transferase [Succinimonas amylolytica]|uniref:prolipoprotein diacylglyceryl transferase n=1 Tax=Succinimonas amylolytica TaxID=83769 RepID=UPI0003755042|nr:prolipoprotein diacylglyceryl transferase [Succinimonas amylolytica]
MILHWNADPAAFTIPFLGDFSVRWYGILFASGFILGYLSINNFFKKHAYPDNDLDNLLFYMFMGTIIGARLGHCFFYQPDFYLEHPIEILKIWKGGLASHGGGIGLIIAVLIFAKKYDYHFLPLADLLCIPTAFEGSMIRLGNFFNSEIYGKATDGTYGIVFEQLHENFPRHPVQLYESVAYLSITGFLVVCYKYRQKRRTGMILGLFLIFVFTTRMILEVFKPEQADYNQNAVLTVGQYLSIPFIAVGCVLVTTSLFSDKLNNQDITNRRIQKKTDNYS